MPRAEPEVADFAHCLNAMGARVEGAGGDIITIHGVGTPARRDSPIIPDRIETGTYLRPPLPVAGASNFKNTRPDTLEAVLENCAKRAPPSRSVTTGLKSSAAGALEIGEHAHRTPSRLPHRYAGAIHGAEQHLPRQRDRDRNHFRKPLHARARAHPSRRRYRTKGNTAVVRGVPRLDGAIVMATDLALPPVWSSPAWWRKAKLPSSVSYHIDRGYECIEEKAVATRRADYSGCIKPPARLRAWIPSNSPIASPPLGATASSPRLVEYIAIPAKSPLFDPDWAAHGCIERGGTGRIGYADRRLWAWRWRSYGYPI